MPFTAHKDRRVYPPDLYSPPEQPHHIHRVEDDEGNPIVCTDHRPKACPDEHWIGGHPEVDHPHHVEYDGETGQWGYTRLTDEEIADLKVLEQFEAEQRATAQAAADERLTTLRRRATKDPDFAALLEHLGLA